VARDYKERVKRSDREKSREKKKRGRSKAWCPELVFSLGAGGKNSLAS